MAEISFTAIDRRSALHCTRLKALEILRMDANEKSNNNPFANGLCSLEWISRAMEAARQHNESQLKRLQAAESFHEQVASRDGPLPV
jgi:hypothetical protein